MTASSRSTLWQPTHAMRMLARRPLVGSFRLLVAAVALAVTPAVFSGAAAASGATSSINVAGKTSQRRSISFTLAGGAITHLQYHIVDRCARGRQLFVHDSGFPAPTITDPNFGGKFYVRLP